MEPLNFIYLFIKYFTIIFTILSLIWHIWLRSTVGIFKSSETMKGKIVLITGGNSGLGLETVNDLARRGAKIIMASRQIEKAQKVKDKIVKETGNDQITICKLDLSSQLSVREFCKLISAEESKIDVLIHNSGCASTTKKKVSVDGLETTFATNIFGPYLLTHLLIDLLKSASSPRIVIVSSAYYKIARLNFDTLNAFETFPMYLYYLTKTANIMFGLELAKRLKSTGISVHLVNPGMCNTSIFKKVPFPLNLIVKHSFKTAQEGAQTIIMCAVSNKIQHESGGYYSDCKREELMNFVKNEEKNKRFWEKSYEIIKLTENDPRI